MKPLDPRLVRRSRAVRRYLVLAVMLGLLTVVVIIAQAVAIAAAVNALFSGTPALAAAAFAGGCLLLRAALQWAQSTASSRAAGSVKAEMRREIADDLLDPRRLGPAPQSSTVIALLGPGLDAFDGYVGRFLPQVVLASVVPGLVVVAVLVIDPVSALIIGVTLPLSIVFMILVGLTTRGRLDRRWAARERLSQHFAVVLDGLVLLKLFGRRQEEGLRQVGERQRRETVRSLRVAFLSSLVLELVATLSVALVAVSVGLRVVENDMALQPALIVLLLAPEAFLPVRQLGMMYHDSTEGAAAVATAFELLDHPRHTGHDQSPDLGSTDIVLDRLVVEHDGRPSPSLRVDAERIHPGEFVAITGSSGSGKSTLLAVLLAFTAPTSGRVTLAGSGLDDIDPVQWRRHIAWVPQVPGLIEGTIEDNVRMGDLSATVAEVGIALRDAGAQDLPLARRISESGDDVSAGERRRIAIARALLRVQVGGAQLMLLDEPTAGLDSAREAAVVATLRAQQVTVIVVAHHPGTIAAADRVVRLRADQLVPA